MSNLKKSSVLTLDEVKASLSQQFEKNEHASLITLTNIDTQEYFFISHYRIPEGVDDKDLSICQVTLPIRVVPREGLESGYVDSVEEYIYVFHKGEKLLESIDEVRKSLEYCAQ